MPPKRKTIQDIKPTKRATTARKKISETREEAVKALHLGVEPMPPKTPRKTVSKKSEGSGGKKIWMLVSFAFVFFIFAFSLLFSGAKVIITPNQITLPEGKILVSAKKNSTSELSFQTIKVEGERSTTAQADGVEETTRPATGIVTLYNDYSTARQNLLIDTRLRGSNGQIYKTKTAVSIPGRSTVGGEVVPGSVDVEVYADVPGEAGNIGMSDFVIVGFVGTSKETGFYGRSKTPISGGFTGELHSLGAESAQASQSELRDLLRADLESKLSAQVPEGFVLLHEGGEYKTIAKTDRYEGDSTDINIYEEGSLTGIIVDAEQLAEALAEEVVTTYTPGDPIEINNIRGVVVALEGSAIGLEALENLTISVSGKVHLVWKLDEDKIKYDLIGTRKKQFESIMARYEHIMEARIKLKPFWHSKVSDEIGDIEVEYKLD